MRYLERSVEHKKKFKCTWRTYFAQYMNECADMEYKKQLITFLLPAGYNDTNKTNLNWYRGRMMG